MKRLATNRTLLLGALCTVAAALSYVGCSSDDAGSPGTSSDAGNDTTTLDHFAPDASDAATDAGQDGGNASCTAYDASGLDEASVAAGHEQVWQVYRCWQCHQKKSQTVDDAGNGIVLSGNSDGLGDSGTIFPQNLTSDPTTGLGCWTDQQIQQAMLEGTDPEGGALCPPMAKFGHPVPTADGGIRAGTPMDAGTAQEIVDFLRSLPPVVNQVPDTSCPAMDAGPHDG